AYSIAMMLLEIQESKATNITVQIFATDLSDQAIRKARIGVYTKQELETVSPKRIQRFFTKATGGFRVNKAMRDVCIFAVHNILQDPPFSRLDFISCCNLFIYLDNPAQKKAVNTFHYALNEDGYLMLGKSENITQSANLFTGFNKKFKLFARKVNTGARILPSMVPRYAQPTMLDKTVSVENKSKINPHIVANHNRLDNAIDAILVSDFMPASVVINYQLEIVQFRGNTDLFLSHPKGKATFNVLKMARPEIAFELRNSISKVIKSKHRVRKSGIEVKVNSTVKIVRLEILPLKIDSDEPLLLILFTEQEHADPTFLKSPAGSKGASPAKDRRIKKLEEELAAAHADALALAQEQEAFTEELQSANEEVVSSNEELQTVNEELETSKEEIESANEELTTTNQELQTRNDLLNESYNYSEAIIATMHHPLVVLDKNLRVKSANQAFYKNFKATEEETEGVLLYNLGNKQWNIPRLRELLEDILPKNTHFYDFEITHTFPLIGEKIMLLNASRILQKTNHEELILLAIEDVTEVRNKAIELQRKEKEILLMQIEAEKNSRKIIEESEKRYNLMLMQSPFAFAVLKGKDMVITMANESVKNMWGKGSKIEGKPLLKVLPELKDQVFPTLLQNVYSTGIPYTGSEVRTQLKRKGKMEEVYFNFVYQPYREADETISGVAIIALEVTSEAEINKKVKESEENFRQLAELLPQKIVQADASGTVSFYNQNWLSYSGLSPKGLKADGWKRIVHPDELEEITKRWLDSTQSGSNFEMELRLLNKQGEYKWHLGRATAMKDDQGNITKWLGAATEIQKQVEQRTTLQSAVYNRTNELKQANEELVKMNKELEAFTYVSSHDLQEPLRKIQTFASRILEKEYQNLSEKGKEYFLRMQNAADRMQTLIVDLLAFSRLSMAERKFEITDINTIIKEVQSELKESIAEKNATIEVQETCNIKIIPFQFRQVMHNLIGNALKFSNPQIPPHVIIKSHLINSSTAGIAQLKPETAYAHIAVSDNGIGFEKEFAEKIFEVFQKLHGKEEYAGTGIGLAIVKKIIDSHNGIITATSMLNKGTTFDIYIPG
nr:PAS domain S-box protein [Chitinophagaceae bacterium]